MANSFEANAFTNNFVKGFSFVDSIRAGRRQEARLEERLQEEREERRFQRARERESDELRREENRFTRRTREEERVRTQRSREATALMASANPDLEELAKFSDFPEVSAFLRQRGLDAQQQADIEALSGSGLEAEAAAAEQAAIDEQVPAAGQEGLVNGIQSAAVPGAVDAPVVESTLTPRELNQLADTDPEQALAIRDQQVAAASPPQQISRPGILESSSAGPRGQQITEERKRKRKGDQVRTEWEMFNDINDPAGDSMRRTDSSILTSKYFEDRSTLTPAQRTDADKRMRPHIERTIQAQQAQLAAAEPGSAVARNATRKLSEVYGLVQETIKTTSPTDDVGVNRGGLPTSGAPTPLIDSVVQQTQEAAGDVVNPEPRSAEADRRLANRQVRGKRIPKRAADAAFRTYKRGEWTLPQYQHYLQTGEPPVAEGTFEQFDVDKDTYKIVNGRRILVQAARDPDNLGGGIRNTIGGDALKQLNLSAKQFNTDDYPGRGIGVMNAFLAVLAEGETDARANGYDYTNINDVMSLWQRYNEISVIRDEFNDEFMHGGEVDPDFATTYGTGAAALFNRDLDTLDRQSIADFFAEAPSLTPLKARPPGFYDQVRANAAAQGNEQFANATDEEIEAAARAEGR